MGDDQQGDALTVQRLQGLDYAAARVVVQVAGGLVGQDHLRAHDGGAGNGGTLALAPGELVRPVPGSVLQAHGGEDAAATVRREKKKVGRNQPCPCGSGKKYKKCCMRKQHA